MCVWFFCCVRVRFSKSIWRDLEKPSQFGNKELCQIIFFIKIQIFRNFFGSHFSNNEKNSPKDLKSVGHGDSFLG